MHHPHNTPLLSADPQATAARSLLREVRHPNSVTAPPVHRGSMPALPWQGFWKSVARALTGRTPRAEGAEPAAAAQPWPAPGTPLDLCPAGAVQHGAGQRAVCPGAARV